MGRGPRDTLHRAAAGVGALAAGLATALAVGVGPAQAAGLGATATTTTSADQGATTRLAGLAVTGASAGDTLAVTVATTRGQLKVDTSTGVTLAYGNAAQGASVAFTGSPAQVDAALAATDLVSPAGSAGQSATISLTAYQQQAGIVYDAGTGHFYEYVAAANIAWDAALSQAASRSFQGQNGYLVSITTSAENDVVKSRIPGALNVWIGAHAVAGSSAREWQWAAGPDAGQVFSTCTNATGLCNFATQPGYSAWASGEPNNYGGTTGVDGEWVAVTNWTTADGKWNDLPNSYTVAGYVVEYGGTGTFSGLATASSSVAIIGTPGAPTGVDATSGLGQASVAFSAPASDGGSTITGYTVTASPGGASATCASSPCVVTGLAGGTSYTFTVTATNAIGTSSASSPSSAVVAGLVPATPTGGTGTALVGHALASSLSAAGYPAPTFAVTAGALPAGLSLDAATGALTGTPTSTGTSTFTVTATNTYGSAAAAFSVSVESEPSAIGGTLPSLVWGSPVAVLLTSTGDPAPTFTVTAGALPAGLTLDGDTGALVGTPTHAGSYSVTIAATNVHGSSEVTYSGTVAAVVPGAPAGLSAVRGDGRAVLTFDAPGSDGGSTLTGYEVSVDGGPWASLTTTAEGAGVAGTVEGLVNGIEVQLRVRAVNAVGAGPASGRVGVLPVAPPPLPVDAPTAVAGVASATVTWTASTERDVTGYTVVAQPGPATCEVTAAQTSCVVGAQAGVPVRFTVVTHSRWGDSAASWSSAAVTPTAPVVQTTPPAEAPTTLTTEQGMISSIAAGETVVVVGTGFAPWSTATVVIYSTPRVLGTVQTDGEGAFRLPVQVPLDLEAGQHTFVAYGVQPSGEDYAMTLPVVLPADATTLARTGAASLDLAALTLLLVAAGAVLRVGASRARARAGV